MNVQPHIKSHHLEEPSCLLLMTTLFCFFLWNKHEFCCMLMMMPIMTIVIPTLWKCGQDVSPPIAVPAFSPQQPQSRYKASSIIFDHLDHHDHYVRTITILVIIATPFIGRYLSRISLDPPEILLSLINTGKHIKIFIILLTMNWIYYPQYHLVLQYLIHI